MASRPHAHYMGLAGPALRVAIGVVAGLCFVAFGYGQGDIGGLLLMESFRHRFPSFDALGHIESFSYSVMAGLVVACWNLGCFLGAFLTIFSGDHLGRKGSIITGLALEFIGKVIQASSFGMGQYISGRIIAGIGNGFIASTIPAWQAECLKTHRRGTLLLVSFGTCITLGVTLAYWIVYAFSFAQPNSVSWRFPIIFAAAFILPAFFIVCFMPESPRWLLLQAREQEAVRVLSALNEIPEDHEDIRREMLQIKNAVKHMASAPVASVFSNGEYRYLQRMILAIALQVMQQWTGINLFIQYLGAMFCNQLHFQPHKSMLLAAGCSLEFFVVSVIAVIGIDRFWGRRTLTIFGASGMCLCMVLLCVMNYLGMERGLTQAYDVMAAFLFLYLTFFSVGWQGMSWMWAVELVPLSIRGPVNAMSTAANWLCNFIVVFVTPYLFTNLTYRTYIIFAVFNFAFVPTIYFFYPETGGRSLEEVDIVFKSAYDAGNPWLGVVHAARQLPKWFDKNGEPTDSYGGSEKDDVQTEKGFSSDDTPDALFPNQRPSTSGEVWETRGAAPAPSIRRTHSSERTRSQGSHNGYRSH